MTKPRPCLKINCGVTLQTNNLFCSRHFWMLPEELRIRLQIGKTKTSRRPTDKAAARKYALVASDAIEYLRGLDASKHIPEEKTHANQEKGRATG